MKMPMFLSAMVILAVSQLACAVNLPAGRMVGNGKVVTETREISAVDSVGICCGMQLVLTQGASQSLELEMEENLLPYVETIVSGSELSVRLKTGVLTGISTTRPMIVRLRLVDIRGVSVSGGGRLESASFKTDSLQLSLAGGSNGEITKISADTFSADLSSGSNLQAVGDVGQLTLAMSGGGDSNLGDLASASAAVDLSGGSSALIWVTNSLTASLSGGSQLSYYGSPTLESVNISGGSGMDSRGGK